MDAEERKKKLQAGKERLAAFQRKKARKKKKPRSEYDGGVESSADEMSDTSSLADLSQFSGEESDLSESESGEDFTSRQAVNAQMKLKSAVSRITELEESLMGKQFALEQMSEENQKLKETVSSSMATTQPANQQPVPEQSQNSMQPQQQKQVSTDLQDPESKIIIHQYNQKIHEFQVAIMQRDEVIKQLSNNLQIVTASRNTLQLEYTTQAEQLAAEVHSLQQQLQQAGSSLQAQQSEEIYSALIEAKNQLLALRTSNQEKDRTLQDISTKFSHKVQELNKLQDENAQIKEREKENSEAIEQLLAHVENLQKSDVIEATSPLSFFSNEESDMSDVDGGGWSGDQSDSSQRSSSPRDDENKVRPEDWKRRFTRLTNQIQSSQSERTKLLETVQLENASYKTLVEELNAKLNLAVDEKDSLGREVEMMQGENSSYKTLVEELNAKLKLAVDEKNSVSTEADIHAERSKYLESVQEENASYKTAIEELKSKLDSANEEKESLCREIDSFREKLTNLQEVHENEVKVAAESHQRALMLALEEQNDKNRCEREELMNQISSCKGEIGRLTDQLNTSAGDVQAQYQQLSAENKRLETQYQETVQNYQVLYSHYQLKDNTVTERDREIESLREQVKMAESQKPSSPMVLKGSSGNERNDQQMTDAIIIQYEEAIAKLKDSHEELISMMKQEQHKQTQDLEGKIEQLNKDKLGMLFGNASVQEKEMLKELSEKIEVLKKENEELKSTGVTMSPTAVSSEGKNQNDNQTDQQPQQQQQQQQDGSKSIQEVIEEYESKMADLVAEHEQEVNNLEQHMLDQQEMNLSRQRVELEFDLKEDLKAQAADLERRYNKQADSLKAENHKLFVCELQKVRKELIAQHEQALEEQRIRFQEANLHQTTGPVTEEVSALIGRLTDEKQLESLKADYEHQVAALKQDLAQQQQQTQQHEEASATAAKCQQQIENLESMRTKMDSAQQEVFDAMVTQLQEVHQHEIQHLQSEFKDELKLQMDALKIALTQVHSGQMTITKGDMEMERELSINALRAEHELELQRIRDENQQLMDEHQKQSANPDTADESTGDLLSRLSGRLSEAHDQAMRALQPSVDASVLEASEQDRQQQAASLRQTLTNQEPLSQEQLVEFRAKLVSEFEQLRSLQEAILKQQRSSLDAEHGAASTVDVNQISLVMDNNVSSDDSKFESSKLEQAIKSGDAAYTESEMAEKITNLEESHQNRLDKIKTELLSEIDQIKSEHEIKLNDLNQKMESLQQEKSKVDELLEELSGESGEYKSKHERLVEQNAQLLKEHKQELEALQHGLRMQYDNELSEALAGVRQTHAAEVEVIMADLADKVAAEVTTVKQEYAQVIADKDRQLAQLKTGLDNGDLPEIKELKQSLNAQFENQQAEFEEQRQKLQAEHAKMMEDRATEAKNEVEKLRQELEREHQEQMRELRQSHETQIEKVHTEWAEKLERAKVTLEEEHAKMVSESRDAEMERINREWAEKLESTKALIEEEQSKKLKESNEAEIEKINIEWAEKLENAKTLMEEEQTKKLKEKYEAEIEKINIEWAEKLENAKTLMEEEQTKKLKESSDAEIEKINIEWAEKLENAKSLMEEEQTKKLKEHYDAEIEKINIEWAEKLENAKSLMEEEQTKKLKENYDAEIEKINIEWAEKLENAKTLMEEEQTNKLKENYNAEIEKINIEWAEKLENATTLIEKETKNRENSLQTELEQLRATHNDDLEQAKMTIKEDLLAENMQKLEVMTTELEKSHQLELQLIREEIKTEYEGEFKQLKDQLNALEKDHEKKIEEINKEWQQKMTENLKRAKEEWAAAHEEMMGAAAADTDAVKLQLDAAQKQELEELQEKLQKQFSGEKAKIEENYKTWIEEMVKTHKEDIERLSSEHEEEKRKLREEIDDATQTEKESVRGEMEALKQRELAEVHDIMENNLAQQKSDLESNFHEREMQLSQEYQQKVTQMTETHDQEMSQMKERLEQVTAESEKLQKELTSVKEASEKLAEEMATKRDEHHLVMERREREHQESGNLVTMLQSDLNTASADREESRKANEHLLHILSDCVRVTLATEENINKRLAAFMAQRMRPDGSPLAVHERDVALEGASAVPGLHADLVLTSTGVDQTEDLHESSVASFLSDEGLDVSQRISESIFTGPDLEPEAEEVIFDASRRLHGAVEKLLEMVTMSTQQLQEAQDSQSELLGKVSEQTAETRALCTRIEDLESQLKQETEAREYLAIELNKAEGLIEGYAAEKITLTEGIQTLEDKKDVLVVDLERAQTRVHELEAASAELAGREDDINRQKEILERSIGKEEQAENEEVCYETLTTSDGQGLFQENMRLAAERRDMEKQLSQDRDSQESRMQMMEARVDEISREHDRLMEDKLAQIEDLNRQLEALDKQLKANKQFLDEQAAEREQEHEDYTKELSRLQGLLKDRDKQDTAGHRLHREIQDLEDQLKERIDANNDMILKKEQTERHLQGQISDGKDIIRQLEAEIESKANELTVAQRKITQLQKALSQESDEDEDSSIRSEKMSDSDLRRLLSDLQSQLEEKTRSEVLAIQRRTELQEDVQKLQTLEQEMSHDRAALRKQVNDQLEQVSSLKLQIEDLKHSRAVAADDKQSMDEVKRQLATEQEASERKDKEIADLEHQLEAFRDQIVEKDDELQQLIAQNEITEREANHHQEELTSQLAQAVATRAQHESEIGMLRSQIDSTPMTEFTQILLQEKNDEIDDLNNQIRSLQAELDEKSSASNQPQLMKELQDQLEQRSSQITALEKELEQKGQDEVTALTEVIHEKEVNMEQMSEQIEGLTREIENLNDFQVKLQEDFDTVQSMLEDKQREIELLTKELEDSRPGGDGIAVEIQMKYEDEIRALRKELKETQNVVDEKAEEMYILNEQIEKQHDLQTQLDNLKRQLEEKTQEVEKSREENVLQQRNGASDQRVEQEVLVKTTASFASSPPGGASMPGVTGAGDTVSSDEKDLEKQIQQQTEALSDLRDQLSLSQAHLKVREEELTQARAELEDLRHILDTGRHKHSEDLALMRQHWNEDVQGLNTELAQARALLQAATGPPPGEAQAETDTQAMMQQALDDLRAEHQKRIKELQESHNNELSSTQRHLEEEYEQRVMELRQRHADETSNTKRHMEELHAAQLNKLRAEHVSEMQRLKDAESVEDLSTRELGEQLNTELEISERLDSNLLNSLSSLPRQDGVGREQNSSRSPLVATAGNGGATSSEAEDYDMSEKMQTLLNRIHKDGVKVLTLTELQFLRQYQTRTPIPDETDVNALQRAWENEKHSLLAAVQSLKQLLAEMQKAKNINQYPEQMSDWRADLLRAVHLVFSKEREGLLSELRTHVVAHGDKDMSSIQALEQRTKEQELHHKSSMQQLESAERESLLAENRELHAQMTVLQVDKQEEAHRLLEQLSTTEEQASRRERQLKRQIELIEYKLQQEKVIVYDARSSLEIERSRVKDLTEQLSREKEQVCDLQSKQADTECQLGRTKDQLDKEQNRALSATSALDEERIKSKQLLDDLSIEQANCLHYQHELQTERERLAHSKEREGTSSEKLRHELEHEKDRRLEAENSLEREHMTVSSLRRDLDFEREQLKLVTSKLKAKTAELRTALQLEKSKSDEINSALHRERTLNTQLRDNLDEERGHLHDHTTREKSAIIDLQALLDLERSKVLDLQHAVERERYKSAALVEQLENQKSEAAENLDRERAACRQMRNSLDSLQSRIQDLLHQLDIERDNSRKLHGERERLQVSLTSTKEQEREKENQRDQERQMERKKQREREKERENERQKQMESDSEIQRLRSRNSDLEGKLLDARRREVDMTETSRSSNARQMELASPLSLDTDQEELHDALHNELSSGLQMHSPAKSMESSPSRDRLDVYRRQLEAVRQRLHLLAVRHQEELRRTQSIKKVDNENLQPLINSLKEMMTELRLVQSNLMLESEEEPCLADSMSVHKLSDKILSQNAELAGFVSRLSEEKQELRSALSKLEEEIWRYRQKDGSFSQPRLRSADLEEKLNTERANWSRERANITLKLHEAEREVGKLKAEHRRQIYEIQREQEHVAPSNGHTSITAQKEKIQKIYGKYLRAESYRKALVYQKRYLLLLLGGFQDCEEETLSLIAKMGVYPTTRDLSRRSRHGPGFTRFRVAVRVIIATSRLRFMVKKWKRATRVGSSVIEGSAHSSTGANYLPASLNNSTSSLASLPNASSNHVSTSYHHPYPSDLHPHHHHRHQHHQHQSVTGRSYTAASRYTSPPTRDRDVSVGGKVNSYHSANPQLARRKILGSLEAIPSPSPTASVSSGRADTPTSVTGDDSADEYIQRLEQVQQRLGNLYDGSQAGYHRRSSRR